MKVPDTKLNLKRTLTCKGGREILARNGFVTSTNIYFPRPSLRAAIPPFFLWREGQGNARAFFHTKIGIQFGPL